MKISFEIDDKEAALLLQALKVVAANSQNENTLAAVQTIIREINEDINNGTQALALLKTELKDYADSSPIIETSNFRTELGLSKNFIESNNGLVFILNRVLTNLIRLNKPYTTPIFIKKTAIDSARTIADLKNLIITNYEASK